MGGGLRLAEHTVHLSSNLRQSNESQAFECGEMARCMAAEEDRIGHRRTLVFLGLQLGGPSFAKHPAPRLSG